MPSIRLTFDIKAPKNRCFDLSRSIDLHKISTQHTNEEAIDGVTTGLIGHNESVTWRAKHFGVYQKLRTRITEFRSPEFFVDEMEMGAFKRFRHEHHFEDHPDGTRMTDYFDYESRFGIIGKIADRIFLKNYMIKLLIKRNGTIKEFAETDKWKQVL